MGHHTSDKQVCTGGNCECKTEGTPDVKGDCNCDPREGPCICLKGQYDREPTFEEKLLEQIARLATAIETANWIAQFPPVAPAPPVLPYVPQPVPYVGDPVPTGPWTIPYTGDPWNPQYPYTITWGNGTTMKVGYGEDSAIS